MSAVAGHGLLVGGFFPLEGGHQPDCGAVAAAHQNGFPGVEGVAGELGSPPSKPRTSPGTGSAGVTARRAGRNSPPPRPRRCARFATATSRRRHPYPATANRSFPQRPSHTRSPNGMGPRRLRHPGHRPGAAGRPARRWTHRQRDARAPRWTWCSCSPSFTRPTARRVWRAYRGAMPAALIWLVFALGLAAAEALTGDMFLLMLSGGALAAAGSNWLLGLPLWGDGLVFLIVSVLLVVGVRPALRRKLTAGRGLPWTGQSVGG